MHLFFCDNKIDSNEYKRMIESEILPFIDSHQKKDFIFQHDNAPAHWSRLVQEHFASKNIKVLPAPQSPEMNIVERVSVWISGEVYQESKTFNVR